MAKIGNVEFNLIDEKIDMPNNVTDHSIEGGSNISDHVHNDNITVSVNGFVGDSDSPLTTQKKLIELRNNTSKTIKYSGRTVISSCLIQDLSFAKDSSSKKGFSFSMKLKQVNIVGAKKGNINSFVAIDTKGVSNKGRVIAL